MQGVQWRVEHSPTGAVVLAETAEGYALRVSLTNEQVLMIKNGWPIIEQMTQVIKKHYALALARKYSELH